ncbi:RNA polymerase sigma factor [Bradyrhizobium sp. USDA 10063]
MSESGADFLRRWLLLDYDNLKRRLAKRLGSVDRADDALHDTWVRLEGTNQLGVIHQPQRYLFRIAYRQALAQLRKTSEQITLDEARAALDLRDDAPSPEQVVEARSEIDAVAAALAELSPRRRAILLASRVEGTALKDIAVRHRISQRMVEIEVKLTLIHCSRRLGRKIVQRFGPRPSKGSP